ncbi:MAG: phage terminase large subunit [Desulfobacteraceae bacterium]|jgi:predicted phage terminase large subunit-like protein
MTTEILERPNLIWGVGANASQPVSDLSLPWTKYIPIKPTPPQLAFMFLPCLEALYGGAGGGGKSVAILASQLQYVDIPGYHAIIIRKTYSDLSLPEALMDVSHSWLDVTDARWSAEEKTWHFPTEDKETGKKMQDATLSFGYLDAPKDRFRYQSAAFQSIAFDELTQFEELFYTYMFSRLRRPKCPDHPDGYEPLCPNCRKTYALSKVPLRMRSASNPGNIGHEWVKNRFGTDPKNLVAVEEARRNDRIFLPAKLQDNPYLDKESYNQSLDQLDPITRQQIKEGDWTARHGGNKFHREWFEVVEEAPVELTCCRFWDMAATEPEPGKDPDYTVGLKLGLSKDRQLFILDIRRIRATPLHTETLIVQTAEIDGKHTKIRMEQEPGSSGVKAIDDYKRRVLMGYDFVGVSSTGSKEVRANPVASQAQAGNIKIVRASWNSAFLNEVELFPTGAHDDQVDALSGALSELVAVGKPLMIG